MKPNFPILIQESLLLPWNCERATHKNTFLLTLADSVQPGLGSRAAAEGSAGQTTCQNSSPSRRWVDVTAAEQKNLPGWKKLFLRSGGNICQVFRFPPSIFPLYKSSCLIDSTGGAAVGHRLGLFVVGFFSIKTLEAAGSFTINVFRPV